MSDTKLLEACELLIEEAALANELIEVLSKTAKPTLGEVDGVMRYNVLIALRSRHRAAIAEAKGARP